MGFRRPDPAAVAETELVARLRAGEEAAFVALAGRHQATMLRLASTFVPSTAVAEEVVQDTWVAVLRGLDGFDGRASFKTWLLAILVNRAKSAGMSEARSLPVGDAGPAVDRSRFDAAGAWASPPRHWVEESEDRLMARGLRETLELALKRLPSRQRAIVILRDVDGLSGEEVCGVLRISAGNQRVLLHRARSHLRAAVEEFVER
ncbi:MAG TPA: sigma-70 family RNA polymerase sigma factor [Solirubrobacterales bacterium]|nr:sigma-70 family RNA polymerase sigma factor [Solirubrobacterales bacterium]